MAVDADDEVEPGFEGDGGVGVFEDLEAVGGGGGGVGGGVEGLRVGLAVEAADEAVEGAEHGEVGGC